jgi:rhodanese-related sulfurtransferase
MILNLTVLDVRKETEFGEGHIKGAVNLPLAEMTDVVQLAQFEDTQNLYVHCAGGYRSVIAASLLKREGVHNHRNIIGGWGKIKQTGRCSGGKRSQYAQLINLYFYNKKSPVNPGFFLLPQKGCFHYFFNEANN